MRVVEGRYRDDGRPARLLEIEEPEDFDRILGEIASSGYYGGDYHARMSGQQQGLLISHFWALAQVVRSLQPQRVLDVGCGRGDVLHVLATTTGVPVHGIEFSEDAVAAAWPTVRPGMQTGDLTEVLPTFADGDAPRPDVVCGLDVWEHLHPARLDAALQAFADAGSEDALYVAVLPAYGVDRVFGEQHAFPFEVNRPDFEAHRPWRFLYADPHAPTIPYAGHLTWADTVWWEERFSAAGLHRQDALERDLHVYDDLLPYSVKSFYVLAKRNDASRRRVDALVARGVRRSDLHRFALRTAVATPRWKLRFDRSERRAVLAWWTSLGRVETNAVRALLRRTGQIHRLDPSG